MCILLDVMIEILERYFNGHRFSKMCRYNVILNEMARLGFLVQPLPRQQKVNDWICRPIFRMSLDSTSGKGSSYTTMNRYPRVTIEFCTQVSSLFFGANIPVSLDAESGVLRPRASFDFLHSPRGSGLTTCNRRAIRTVPYFLSLIVGCHLGDIRE